MKVEELRVKNLIYKDGEIKMFTPSDMFSMFNIQVLTVLEVDERFSPIPLTEEWLLKFGFERWGSYTHLWKRKSQRLTVTLNQNAIGKHGLYGHGCDYELNDMYRVGVQHVHQLQNLYFALTGKELELI